MSGTRWVTRASLISALAACIVAGCNVSAPPTARQEESNLKKLALFYGPYQGRHQGQLPPDEAAFKAFIKEQQLLLDDQGIKDVDAFFVSERDKQPYVILYAGDTLGTDGPGGQPVVAYEQRGSGGKRFVASSLGAVDEVDDAKFKEWVKNPK